MILFQNAACYHIAEFVEHPEVGGWQPCRIPSELRRQLTPRGQRAAFFLCGTELRFLMQGEQVEIVLSRVPGGAGINPAGIVEVYQGIYPASYSINPQVITTEQTVITIPRQQQPDWDRETQPFDPAVYRVFLPYDYGCYIHEIRGELTPPRADQVSQRHYLCYGSSITHGGSGTTPTKGYARLLADRLGMDLQNYGFAGSAYLDEPVAQLIAKKQDWDVATIELGVNVLGEWTVTEFAEKAAHFLRIIADAQRKKPVFVIDIFRNHHDARGEEKVVAFRSVVRELVAAIGQKNIHYVNGLQLLTRAGGLSADGLHPSDVGHAEIAANLYQAVLEFL